MRQVVQRYPLKVEEMQEVRMIEGARIIKFAFVDGEPNLWALSDLVGRPVSRKFYMLGTGCSIDGGLKYIDTFTALAGDAATCHLFEEVER